MKTLVGVLVAMAILFTIPETIFAQKTSAVGGEKCPGFEVDDYKGNTVKLADFSDKVVIIHHMLPGCGTCNDQIAATKAMQEKYGKENVKVIAFIFDGTFNDDKDREQKRGLIKKVVEDHEPAIEGQSVPVMEFDAYIVWHYATYVKHLTPLRFKKEPLLTCIVDKDGNFAYRQTETNVSKDKMDECIAKLLKPVNGEAPKEAPKGDDLDPQTAADLFKEAIEQMQKKKYDESIAAFKRISDKFGKEDIGFTSAYNVACGYALKGDKVQALEWLEKAIDNGFGKFEHIKQDTDLDSLRDEPKYKDLMSKEPM